jgi:hypothetical protein
MEKRMNEGGILRATRRQLGYSDYPDMVTENGYMADVKCQAIIEEVNEETGVKRLVPAERLTKNRWYFITPVVDIQALPSSRHLLFVQPTPDMVRECAYKGGAYMDPRKEQIGLWVKATRQLDLLSLERHIRVTFVEPVE